MTDLFIEGNHQTPEIKFKLDGELSIKGRSIPDDAMAFYEPLTQWIKDYFSLAPFDTRFIVDLDYLNINSSKKILEMLYVMDQLLEQGKNPKIIWRYADDEMLEIGQDYDLLLNIPFTFERKQDYIEVPPTAIKS